MTSLILGVVVAIAGSGGLIFGALRYNREEAGKVIAQHGQILADMRVLNEELHSALKRTRDERDTLVEEVSRLRLDVRRLEIILNRGGRSA